MSPDIRDLTADDAGSLHRFLAAMPPEDRTFFFYDVDDPAVADRWVGDGRRRSRAVVGEDGDLLAFASLQPGVDWSSHVAELVLAVSPAHRREGLGKALAREMLLDALHTGYRKVTVQIAADSEGAIRMFRELGFEGEALLRDQLRSPEDDSLRDVVVLAHLVDETWSTMLSGGIDEAVG
jgi:ribosomal protein S18 acetylase RimI-like enzyme